MTGEIEYRIVMARGSKGERPYYFLLPSLFTTGLDSGWKNGTYELPLEKTYPKKQAEIIMNIANKCDAVEQDKLFMIMKEFNGELLSDEELAETLEILLTF